jgi:hypothetical protein
MSYEPRFPNVSQAEPSQAAAKPDPAGAMRFADWDENEARRRISTLLRCGSSVRQLSMMFGTTVSEIDRLTGQSDQPVTVHAREVC